MDQIFSHQEKDGVEGNKDSVLKKGDSQANHEKAGVEVSLRVKRS